MFYFYPHDNSLISTMLVVDAEKRASLEELVSHPWVRHGWEEEDTVPLPSFTSYEDVPETDQQLIINRMVLGGYGCVEDIVE